MTTVTTEQRAAERFAAETRNHQMTVLHDQGLYRHLRFADPNGGEYWFDVVTWPGALAFTGGVGGFTFRRTDDMFTLFRGREPNLTYWSEKLWTGERESVKEYDEETLTRLAAEHLVDVGAEGRFPGVTAAWEEAISDPWSRYDTGTEDGAREALRDFSFGEGGEFQFLDTEQWDLRDYAWNFVWACHAIPWAVGRYDEAQAVAA